MTGTITLTDATDAQRAAVGRLLGRSVPAARSVSVPLERLDNVLRGSGAAPDGLASAVVALAGPVDDPRLREAENQAWRDVVAELDALAADRPELSTWVDSVRKRGRLRRAATDAAHASALVRDLRAVVRALPADGESLAGFAGRVLRRAHALDSGTALGSLAMSAAEVIGGATPARSGPAAWRREVWASVGVLVDDVSSTVLVLNLPGGTASPTGVALAALAAAGQPAVLSLRQIVSDGVGAVPAQVSVCENPAVVSAAADQLGTASAPVICVQGQPGAAATTLLRLLAGDGASIRYHGDFDWGGITIARTLATHVDWLPWRFGASDYLDAISRGDLPDELPAMTGTPLDTPWDPQLSTTMSRLAVRVEEELVLDDLLADLAQDRSPLG